MATRINSTVQPDNDLCSLSRGEREEKVGGPSNSKARHGIGSLFHCFNSCRSSAETNQLKAQRAKQLLGPCIRLMESPKEEDNRKGLQKLLSIAKRKNTGISSAVIYGLDIPYRSRLRDLLVKFLCDPSEAKHNDLPAISTETKPTQSNDELMEMLCENSESTGDSTDLYKFLCEDYESKTSGELILSGQTFETEGNDADDDEDDGPWGLHGGRLHKLALHVLTEFLEQAIGEKEDSQKIDFNCPFWKSIAATIFHNIEVNCSEDISGYSLRCLRQLHSVEQETIHALVLRSLLPYISHLNQYGQQNNHALIKDEASILLQDLAV
jgi:hypothetical protein